MLMKPWFLVQGHKIRSGENLYLAIHDKYLRGEARVSDIQENIREGMGSRRLFGSAHLMAQKECQGMGCIQFIQQLL